MLWASYCWCVHTFTSSNINNWSCCVGITLNTETWACWAFSTVSSCASLICDTCSSIWCCILTTSRRSRRHTESIFKQIWSNTSDTIICLGSIACCACGIARIASWTRHEITIRASASTSLSHGIKYWVIRRHNTTSASWWCSCTCITSWRTWRNIIVDCGSYSSGLLDNQVSSRVFDCHWEWSWC